MNEPKSKVRIAVPSRLDAVLYEYALKKDSGVDLTLAHPREVPGLLRDGIADCALVPAVMYFQGDYLIVPDAAISTFTELSTEILVSRIPLQEVKSVAVPRQPDTARTILEISLRELFPEVPYKFEIGKGNPFKDLEKVDAALISGEGALGVPPTFKRYNIGEFWVRLVELPAVFYLWLVPADSPAELRERAYAHVLRAKKTGLANSDKVVQYARERVTLNKYKMIEYLTVEIDYDLFSKQVKSLEEMCQLMVDYRLIPEEKQKPLEFATARSHVSVFEEVFGVSEDGIEDVLLDWDDE